MSVQLSTEWLKTINGISGENITDIAIASHGIYVVGNYSHVTSGINIGNNIILPGTSNTRRHFIIKYDQSGTPLTVYTISGGTNLQSLYVCTTSSNVFFAGKYDISSYSITLPSSAGTLNANSSVQKGYGYIIRCNNSTLVPISSKRIFTATVGFIESTVTGLTATNENGIEYIYAFGQYNSTVGITSDNMGFSANTSSPAMSPFILKYNASTGTVIYSYSIYSTLTTSLLSSYKFMPNDGLYVCGTYRSNTISGVVRGKNSIVTTPTNITLPTTGTSTQHSFVIKYDLSGNTRFVRTISGSNIVAKDITVGSENVYCAVNYFGGLSGGLYSGLSGYFISDNTRTNTASNCAIIGYNKLNGTVRIYQNFRATTGLTEITQIDINNKYLYVIGNYKSNVVVNLSDNENNTNTTQQLPALADLSSTGFFVAFDFSATPLKVNSLIFQTTVASQSKINSIVSTISGVYVCGLYSATVPTTINGILFPNSRFYSAFTLKYDLNNNPVFVKFVDGSSTDSAIRIKEYNNNYYVIGNYNSNQDFTVSGQYSNISVSSNSVNPNGTFIVKYKEIYSPSLTYVRNTTNSLTIQYNINTIYDASYVIIYNISGTSTLLNAGLNVSSTVRNTQGNIILSNLMSGTTYNIYLRTTYTFGDILITPTIIQRTLYPEIQNLSISGTSEIQRFDITVSHVQNFIKDYVLTVSGINTSYKTTTTFTQNLFSSRSQYQINIQNLESGKLYNIKINASTLDSTGVSNSIVLSPQYSLIGPFTSFTANAESNTSNSMLLSWGKPSGFISGYNIKYGLVTLTGFILNNSINNIASTVTSYQITNLEGGKEYAFQIEAYISQTSYTLGRLSISNIITKIPQFLNISNIFFNTPVLLINGIKLIWLTPPGNISYYILNYKRTGDNYVGQITISGNLTSYTINNLQHDKIYTFDIRAYSPIINTIEQRISQLGTISGIPLSPLPDSSNVIINYVAGDTNILLSWNKSAFASYYDIEYQLFDTSVNLITSTVSYELDIIRNISGDTKYNIINLYPNSAYLIKLKIYNSTGSFSYTNSISVRLNDSLNITISDISYNVINNNIDISWSVIRNNNVYDNFIIYYTSNNTNTYTNSITVFDTKALLSNLIYGKYYKFRIAVNRKNIITNLIDISNIYISYPSFGTFSITSIIPGRRQFYFEWSKPSGILNYYNVYYKQSNDINFTVYEYLNNNTNKYSINVPSPGKYIFYISAFNNDTSFNTIFREVDIIDFEPRNIFINEVNKTETSVKLQWSSTDTDLYDYKLINDTGEIYIKDISYTEYTFNNLINNQNYTFILYAKNNIDTVTKTYNFWLKPLPPQIIDISSTRARSLTIQFNDSKSINLVDKDNSGNLNNILYTVSGTNIFRDIKLTDKKLNNSYEITISGLIAFNTYTYTLYTKSNGGQSSFVSITGTARPVAIPNVSTLNFDISSITDINKTSLSAYINWQLDANDFNGDISGYSLYFYNLGYTYKLMNSQQSLENILHTSIKIINFGRQVSRYTISGLDEGTTYRIQLIATNIDGLSGSYKLLRYNTEVRPLTPIQSLIGNSLSEQVELIWTKPLTGVIVGYNIYVNNIKINKNNLIETTRYIVSGLSGEIQYLFYVIPVDLSGENISAASIIVNITPFVSDFTTPDVKIIQSIKSISFSVQPQKYATRFIIDYSTDNFITFTRNVYETYTGTIIGLNPSIIYSVRFALARFKTFMRTFSFEPATEEDPFIYSPFYFIESYIPLAEQPISPEQQAVIASISASVASGTSWANQSSGRTRQLEEEARRCFIQAQISKARAECCLGYLPTRKSAWSPGGINSSILEKNTANCLPTTSPFVSTTTNTNSTTPNTSSVQNLAAAATANIINGGGMSAGGVSEAVRLARLLQATQDDYSSGADRRFLEYQRFPVQVPFCPAPITNSNNINISGGSSSSSFSGINPFTSGTGSSYTTNQGQPIPGLKFGCQQPNVIGL